MQTGTAYYAKVRTWDGLDVRSEWSESLRFIVPLVYPGDWKADWLTCKYNSESPLPLFRKPFKVGITSDIEFARLYIAAPGYYEAYLNGEKIGDMVLDPGQTNYEDYTYFGFRYAEVRGLRRPSANTENNFPDQEVRSWGQNLFTTSDNAVFLKNWTSQEMSKPWITGCKRPLNWKTSRCPCGWPTGRSMAKRSISSLMIPGKLSSQGLH